MTPAKLKRIIPRLHIPALWIFLISSSVALFDALYLSPSDYLHGDLVRILYVHVPAAWFAVGIYTIMGVFSFM